MKIPAHWSKATAEETDRSGKRVSFSCWRSSELSEEDARRSALAAARQVVEKLMRGDRLDRYGYGEVPLREEVIERFTDPRGELFAVVTRNGYGCLVLNTAGALFIDLDFPPVSFGENLRFFFAKLLGRSPPSPHTRSELDIVGRIEQFLDDNPAWGLRLYRTAGGLRALVTHELFKPSDGPTLDLLDTLGCDPLYVRLCKTQECFRARLTPKPWRCGQSKPAVRWPWEGEAQRDRFDRWLAAYTASQSGYATCRLLGELGNGSVHQEIQTIIEVHDRITKCDEPLKLA